MTPLRPLPLSLVVAVLPLQRLTPQRASDFTLRGTVVTAETSEPVTFGIVEVTGLAPRLTDETGHFQIAALRTGGYHLVVRQIGYVPFDSTIAIPLTSPLLIRLKRLGVLLSPVTVSGTSDCRRPGAPDPTVTPALAIVFDQVVANARRMRLLAEEHPHRLRIERTLTDVQLPRRSERSVTDTLDVKSTDRWPYRPGHIVSRVGYEEDIHGRWLTRLWENQDLIRLPTLEDFADSSFVVTHCFSFVGRDTLQGGTFIRIDFRPTTRIKTSDVAGATYLDSTTYMARYTVVAVTHPAQAALGLISLIATSRFCEAMPGILVTDWIFALSRTRGESLMERTEKQRLITMELMTRPPGP